MKFHVKNSSKFKLRWSRKDRRYKLKLRSKRANKKRVTLRIRSVKANKTLFSRRAAKKGRKLQSFASEGERTCNKRATYRVVTKRRRRRVSRTYRRRYLSVSKQGKVRRTRIYAKTSRRGSKKITRKYRRRGGLRYKSKARRYRLKARRYVRRGGLRYRLKARRYRLKARRYRRRGGLRYKSKARRYRLKARRYRLKARRYRLKSRRYRRRGGLRFRIKSRKIRTSRKINYRLVKIAKAHKKFAEVRVFKGLYKARKQNWTGINFKTVIDTENSSVENYSSAINKNSEKFSESDRKLIQVCSKYF